MTGNKTTQRSTSDDFKVNGHRNFDRQSCIAALYGIRRTASKAASVMLTSIMLSCSSINVLSPVPHEPSSFAIRNSHTKPIYSWNWAGEIVTSDIKHPKPQVSSIEGSWRVPYVRSGCGATSAVQDVMLQWIGIGFGGYFKESNVNDQTLIQVGTDTQAKGNARRYNAWYEVLPMQPNKQLIAHFKIMPGDTVYAKIYLSDPKRSDWTIYLKNMSENEAPFSNTIHFNSSKLSGEWIVERESSGFSPWLTVTYNPLPRSDNTSFISSSTNIGNYATVDGVRGSIYDFSTAYVDMKSSSKKNSDLVSTNIGHHNNIKFSISKAATCPTTQP